MFGEALLDRILVCPGERRVHHVPHIGMALVDGHAGAMADRPRDLVDVGEVDHRIHALGMQIQRQGGDVDIAGAFTVAEYAALHPLGTGQHRQLGAGDAGAPVVVRMHRQDDAVAPRHVAVHVLDLVGIHVRGGDLDGGRQVEDDRTIRGGLPQPGHRVAQLEHVVGLGEVEHLRGEFESHIRHAVGEFEDVTRTRQDQVPQFGAVLAQHGVAPGGRGGGVHVDDDVVADAADRVHGSLDQVAARRHEDHDGDVRRGDVGFRQQPDEVEVGLRRRRITDLDLLVAHGHQQFEEATFAGRVHRLGQCLVAVAQIHRHPQRRGVDPGCRPISLHQRDFDAVIDGCVAM